MAISEKCKFSKGLTLAIKPIIMAKTLNDASNKQADLKNCSNLKKDLSIIGLEIKR